MLTADSTHIYGPYIKKEELPREPLTDLAVLEIVSAAREGLVYAWGPDGSVVAGFPVSVGASLEGTVALLTEFLLLGTGNVGSFALASEQTNLLAMALNALLKVIAETFTDVFVVRVRTGVDKRQYCD